MGPDHKIPKIIGDDFTGHLIWLSLFCFFLLLPMSLPRQLNNLRYTSLVSFCISIFIVLVIFSLCFVKTKAIEKPDGKTYWSFHDRFHSLNHDIGPNGITYLSIFNSIPLMIFMYMYQPVVP